MPVVDGTARRGPVRGQLLPWLRVRDADLSAARCAGRAAVVVPMVFAIGERLIGNPTFAVFAAFGALAMLLFAGFGGPLGERLVAQANLLVVSTVLVCLGTLASEHVVTAVAGTAIVSFLVLFAGVVSSALASVTTALLMSFILPVTLAGPVSSIPDRLAGWGLAGVASMLAVALLWPDPIREPLRLATARAGTLLARRLRAEVDCVRAGCQPEHTAALGALVNEASAAVSVLRQSFFDTPYRPSGLAVAARKLVRLVDQVMWLDAVLDRKPVDQRLGSTDSLVRSAVCEVKLAAAVLLERGATLLAAGTGTAEHLEPELRRLEQARSAMSRAMTTVLPLRRAGASEQARAGHTSVEFTSSLKPSFRAQEMSFAISAIAENIESLVAARRGNWWQRALARQPAGAASSWSSARDRARAHVQFDSVWLHNSMRGAIALGLAVLVTELTGVQHSFWVVLGTLAVLRSNAVNTGQNALRGLLGNVVGVLVGGVLVVAVGTNTTALWLVLPLAVAFAGLAPAAVSFAAGQAGFTMVLLILYNIIGRTGWRIGLVRLEDIAIGCVVSLVVGAFFWPRGAGAALAQAIAQAFTASARQVGSAVAYGVSRCDATVTGAASPQEEFRRATAAAQRLDDAFREYLAERGTKHIALAELTTLINAVAVLRLTADAILELWQRDGDASTGDRTAARAELTAAGARIVDWYHRMARAIAGSGTVPDRLPYDEAADVRLISAVRRDLSGEDGRGTATAVKMIWTADHIDAVRRLQSVILAPARTVAATPHAPRSWLGGRPA